MTLWSVINFTKNVEKPHLSTPEKLAELERCLIGDQKKPVHLREINSIEYDASNYPGKHITPLKLAIQRSNWGITGLRGKL